jgi:hypothetical protein
MKKQMKVIAFLSILSIILFSAFLISLPGKVPTEYSEGIGYHSSVCTYIVREDGQMVDNGCSHNLLTNAGANAIRDALTTDATTVSFSYIGLCNASFGGDCNGTNIADESLYHEFPAGANGLNRTNEATFLPLGIGNWSYSRTFVAGEDNMVTNKTGIFNATSGGTMLAVNTFTTSTLQTGDQITVNWSIWVA